MRESLHRLPPPDDGWNVKRLAPAILVLLSLSAAVGLSLSAAQSSTPRGARDPAWSPDGRQLAISYLDQIWISSPEGRDGRGLRAGGTAVERDPAWTRDGRSIAFAADSGSGFDIHLTTV